MTRRERRVGIIALPGVQMLDVAGPLDVFAEANTQSGRNEYTLHVIGLSAQPIRSSSGMRILPDYVISGEMERFHTVLVAGAPHLECESPTPELLEWLRHYAPNCQRYGSVCSGALVLAAAGLLDGRQVTTHWSVAETLAQHYPTIEVEADALHVRDGAVRTAAGVTAGLDLALALVEEDLGLSIARDVAAQLVMFFRRPGGQLQFSRRGETRPIGRSILQDIQRWIIAHPSENASLQALAQRAGLSPRHFARLFHQELGLTPRLWVEQIRIGIAKDKLETGNHPKQVAVATGFRDIDTFRRAFQRQVGVTPATYRRRFGVAHSR
ncbi:GlxA family transcriptional regulator [Acetobacter orientalis]|uniref:GlxA family transcriptional regulator n=1 Tax=Acetobacter orientalis TaxID=146474 RepID=UPI0039EAF7D4